MISGRVPLFYSLPLRSALGLRAFGLGRQPFILRATGPLTSAPSGRWPRRPENGRLRPGTLGSTILPRTYLLSPLLRLRHRDFGPVRPFGAIPPTALRLWAPPAHEAAGGYAVRSPCAIRLRSRASIPLGVMSCRVSAQVLPPAVSLISVPPNAVFPAPSPTGYHRRRLHS